MKAHVLYDIEVQVPAFYTITTASKHDLYSYETNAYYIFNRAYDSFKELYRIHPTDSFFVVSAKAIKYKIVKIKKLWAQRRTLFAYKSVYAIITYRLVTIVQHNIKLKHSTYEVLQILSISLTDKTHLRDLFYKTNSNDIKDLNDHLISGIFDQLFNSSHFYGTLMT